MNKTLSEFIGTLANIYLTVVMYMINGSYQASGAYIFRPNGTAPTVVSSSVRPCSI
jgi:hypothetical protein